MPMCGGVICHTFCAGVVVVVVVVGSVSIHHLLRYGKVSVLHITCTYN